MQHVRASTADRVVGALAVVALVAGAVVIGIQRARTEQFMYISELGAVGLRTEEWFRWGFVLVIVGIALVGWIVRDVRSRGRVLDRWRPSLSLVVSAAWFLVASQVNCTDGCPAPTMPNATPRDAVHISAAVLGFAAGAWAMLQLATATDRWMRRLSAVGGVLVASIAATGGLISLARANTDVGSTLEYVAAAIGVAWLVTLTIVHLVQRPSEEPVDDAEHPRDRVEAT
ncbi:DUF998 domain-containing protein [Agrococcus sp. SGAir0287]|uniref:DUF998 domain-containing protein n=1 Tax=Agrococcus sp. SGAir0287 TaxID=2070347 RepID=UPI0010CCF5A8|nr:DUF998 domain-containing protein [Agrococcus sp. SGAir0287]QCR18529.1 hypothetical protein C1N71_02915 [Agrococcus sp. SGAir0287]